MRKRVEEALTKIRPALQADGGDVELVDVKEGVVKRVSQEISKVYDSELILVHGAGSFGHPIANEFRLRDGLNEENVLGSIDTILSVRSLNTILVRELRRNSVPAFPISPSSAFTLENGEILSFFEDVIETCLSTGFLPILYGDVVLDKKKGFDILSGDKITVHLAKKYGGIAIFLSDTLVLDGEGNPIEELRGREFRDLGTSGPDVTGGMYGKIREILSYGVEAIIVPFKPGNLERVLKGEECECTRVIP